MGAWQARLIPPWISAKYVRRIRVIPALLVWQLARVDALQVNCNMMAGGEICQNSARLAIRRDNDPNR